jgi:hypothetical protein
MRQFLITKFVCSKCKNILEICNEDNLSTYTSGEPTGCETVVKYIGIAPCSCSSKKYEKLGSAIKEFLEAK